LIKSGSPFVSLALDKQKYKTKAKMGNTPTWTGASFSFSLIGIDEHAEVEVSCWNSKMVGDPDFLGEAFFSIAKIKQLAEDVPKWHPLRTETSSQGEVALKFTIEKAMPEEYDENEDDKKPKMDNPI